MQNQSGMRRTKVIALLAILLALVIPAGGAAADPGPPGDDFYTPPSPLPAGAPGDIIRARPAKAGPPKARALASAWQVMYLSTNANGQPTAVTGMVLVPKKGEPAKAPIVGFAPGTEGPAFRCAPSKMIDSGVFYEQAGINEMLTRGYALAVPDYEGYHQQPTTSYVVGKAMGPALLDAVRAAQRLPEAGLSKASKVLVHGYSQGGGAAMWAGELKPSYAPELNLIGVVGGGVPADLVSLVFALNGAKMSGFMIYALIGMHDAYPELKFDSALSDQGRKIVADMEQDACALELLLDYQDKTIEDVFTVSPIDAAWRGRATENRLGSRKIEVPVFQYHSKTDEIVDFPQGSRLRDKYCALGVQHTWKTWEGLSHITLVYRGNADAFAFMQDRIDGKPAGSTC